MQLICSKNDLVKAVNIVSKAVSAKTSLPVLECVYLAAAGDKLTLIGNDMDLGIKTSIKASVREEGEIAVNSKIFSEIIRRLPEEEVILEEAGERDIKIRSGKAEFSLRGQNAAEFPVLPTVAQADPFVLSQKVFRDMIKNTIFSIAPEDSGRPILTGELIDIRGGYLYLVSVDGFRISMRRTAGNFSEEKKCTVPGKALNELQKILEGEEEALVSIRLTGTHAVFEIEDTTVITRLLDGEFLQYQRNLNMEYPAYAEVATKALLDSVDRAALISRESKNSPIKFQFTENHVIITSNAENGSIYEEVEASYNGEDMAIAFNPKYFLEALKAIESETIRIYLNTSLTPCIMKDPEGEDFKYFILPIRLHS